VAKKAMAKPAQSPRAGGAVNPAGAVSPAPAAPVNCSTCGQPNPSLGPQASSTGLGQAVCGVGRLTVHTTSIGAEKMLAQLTGGAHQGDQVDVGQLQQVLSDRGNSWFGSELAWLFSSGDAGVFTVVPRDADQVQRLAEMLSPPEDGEVIHVIDGCTIPVPAGSPSAAAGLPAVQACQVLSFTLQQFAAGLPKGEGPDEGESRAARRRAGHDNFEALVRNVFYRLTNGAALPGTTDEQQARAFVAVNYAEFYHAISHEQNEGKRLVGVYARHSHSADRRIVSVGFTVRDPQTDMTDGWQCLVDVTECCLHFLAAGLRRTYD
jgi:PatG C-terminal